MNSEFIIIFLLVLLIIVLMYLVYNKKRFYENFANSPTSFDLYKANNSKTFDDRMNDYKNTLYDINDLLLTYGCGINIGTAPSGLDNYINSAIGSSKIYRTPLMSVSSDNFGDVNSKIHNAILDFHDNINHGKKIEGQIYVVISQAPYYRNDNNQVVSLQYNMSEYLDNSTNLMKYTNVISNPRIQYHICLLFTAYYYDNKGVLKVNNKNQRKKAVEDIKRKFRYKESACFMRCANNKNMPCGCASQDKTNADYDSICLETSDNAKMSAGQKYTYAVLYKVNSKFADFTGREILADDNEDYKWSPSTLDAIPIMPPPPPPSTKSSASSSGGSTAKNWFGYKISTNGRCGAAYGKTACPGSQCCSPEKKCGGSYGVKDAEGYCYAGSQGKYHGISNGKYDGKQPEGVNWKGYLMTGSGQKCGRKNNKLACPGSECCSKNGWCSGGSGSSGTKSAWCSYGSSRSNDWHGVSGGKYDGVKPTKK